MIGLPGWAAVALVMLSGECHDVDSLTVGCRILQGTARRLENGLLPLVGDFPPIEDGRYW